MRIFETSKLAIDKVGLSGGEAYLVQTKECALLYDSGFAYSAPALVKEVEELLGERALNYLFLTHSHYDHVSGSVWVKQRWPQVVVLGGASAASILSRPGARETICMLNKEAKETAVAFWGLDPKSVLDVDYSLLGELAVDEVVEEGQLIDMGSLLFEVIEAPGHTRCSLMLWCDEERLLLGSESLGVLVEGDIVVPTFLTSYAGCLESISKAKALQPEHLLLNHKSVMSGALATRFLQNSENSAIKTAQTTWTLAAEGKSKEEIAAALKEMHYSGALRTFQPEAAFDLNNGYMVDLLLATSPCAS